MISKSNKCFNHLRIELKVFEDILLLKKSNQITRFQNEDYGFMATGSAWYQTPWSQIFRAENGEFISYLYIYLHFDLSMS